MIKRIIFFFFFILFSIFLFLLYSTQNFIVNLSFLINFFIILILLIFTLWKKEMLFFNSVIAVFSYVFFWVAPLIQVSSKKFPNTIIYSIDLIIKTNLLIGLFIISYMLGYVFFYRSKGKLVYFITKISFSYKTFIIIFLLSILILFVFFKHISNQLLGIKNILYSNIAINLILVKFLFSIPLFNLYFLSIYKRKFNNKLIYLFLFFSSLLLVLFFKNPFMERRNVLGPIYLTMFFLFIRKKLNNLNLVLILIFILLFAFPLTAALTHQNVNLSNLDSIGTKDFLVHLGFERELKSLHFDAWSNFMATIDYVNNNGFTYGRQLIGSLLFFVPRDLWKTKPIGSGNLIGKYLINNYSMWFFNLSNPLPSEAYINYGLIGVILFGVILSYFTKKLENLKEGYGWVIYFYIGNHLIYILRGDLMSSFAYLVGVLFALIVLPKLIDIFVNTKIKIKI